MVFKNKIFKLEIMKELEKCEEDIINEIRKSINDSLDKEIENFIFSDKKEPKLTGVLSLNKK